MSIKRWFVAVIAVALGGLTAWAAGGQRARMEPTPAVAELLADLPARITKLPPQSPAREAFEAGREDEARSMLAFRPYDEAPLPEGFPAFTPVGVIEVKKYPAYRKAEGPGFWPLFQHIQSESIPMTAPVEMTKASREGRRPMAFLYQHTGVGQTGPAAGDSGVTVVDAPEAIAVSLGVRGRMNPAAADGAKQRLRAWLADHPEYQAVGGSPFRLFGYSSPMVPDTDKYWEAQMLIELAEPATASAD